MEEAVEAIASLCFPKHLGRDLAEVIEVASPTPFDTTAFQKLLDACRTREADLRLAGLILQATAEGWSTQGSPRRTKALWWSWLVEASSDGRLAEAFERETDERAQEILLAAIG